ncbi:MAG: hypothetical protein K2X27_25740 [Candidatus Obscuribacterales bacterium]|nr:hypothetical protein [Candidatus Obscuribacterales bacterium]
MSQSGIKLSFRVKLFVFCIKLGLLISLAGLLKYLFFADAGGWRATLFSMLAAWLGIGILAIFVGVLLAIAVPVAVLVWKNKFGSGSK